MKFSYNFDAREFSYGISKLNFDDNFESYIAEDVVIPAGEEKQITYQLPDGRVAKYYLSLSQTGNGLITKGSTDWTAKHIYLINNGAESVTITIAILGA